MLSSRHQTSLQRIAEFLSETSDPWWVLGSAAMALICVDPGQIRDIDLLVSKRDAEALMRAHHLDNQADGGTDRFRSTYFLKPDLGEIPVEIMAGYEICEADAWRPVTLKSRLSIEVGSSRLFVPDRGEQIDLLKRLGRPKDQARLQRFTA